MPPPATETKTTMFDLSWSHLGIFALAAIVLVPTKDLPALLRNIGRYMGDAKKMARDFRSQVDDALKDAELADIKKTFDAEVKGIATSASMADTERSFNASMNSAMEKACVPATTWRTCSKVRTSISFLSITIRPMIDLPRRPVPRELHHRIPRPCPGSLLIGQDSGLKKIPEIAIICGGITRQ